MFGELFRSRKPRQGPAPRNYRPALESLEDRCLPQATPQQALQEALLNFQVAQAQQQFNALIAAQNQALLQAANTINAAQQFLDGALQRQMAAANAFTADVFAGNTPTLQSLGDLGGFITAQQQATQVFIAATQIETQIAARTFAQVAAQFLAEQQLAQQFARLGINLSANG
jgi:hypothetical protein